MTDYIDSYDAPRAPLAVYWLMGLCVGVYFVQSTLTGDVFMQQTLGYSSGDLARHALWSVVTYMFVHGGLMHLALNLWTLWLFGPRVERAWGSRAFTWFYLWCGVGGWAFHYMFQRDGGTLIGASAAILGVAVAYASRWPNDEVYFFGIVPMKVRWLVVFMALINIAMAVIDHGAAGGTAYAAHIGGMVAGWIYLRMPSAQSLERMRGRITSEPDYGDESPRAVPRHGRPRAGFGRGPEDIVAQSQAALAEQPVPQRAAVRSTTPGRSAAPSALDVVLDKIASSGMESLTPAERLLLDEWSQRLRNTGH